MLQAQQRKLLQETNINIIGIRQAEMNFYTNFYSSIGAQAAIIGGFVYASMNQANIPGVYAFPNGQISAVQAGIFVKGDVEILDILLSCFWVSSAVSMSFAIHCVLCTILLLVFGPGLALLGPVGSMAKANKGLNAEMKQVFLSYLTMVVTFAIASEYSWHPAHNFAHTN